MTLSAADIALTQNTNTSGFEDYISQFANGASQIFLSANNPFQKGIVHDLPGLRAKAAFLQLSAPHISELVFSRGLLHCLDAWSYLGRALSASSAGDDHRVRHLAYYAELRAALSILACHGIGVFNGHSSVVTPAGGIQHLQCVSGTHVAAWLILQEWAKAGSSGSSIAGAVGCLGVPVADCLAAFFGTPGYNFVGPDFFGKLGFDLAQGSNDRETRNFSSYGPTFLTNIAVDASDEARLISSFWHAFAPSESELDRHILRLSIELEIVAIQGDPISQRRPQYENLPDNIKRHVSFDFLTRLVEPDDHLIIRRALDVSQPTPHLSVICRSAILLRMATQLITSCFRRAGVDFFNDMPWCWERIGEQRGLWPAHATPTSLADLWLPIEVAVHELEELLTGVPPGAFNRSDWIDRPTSDIPRLSEAERAGLWALSA
jgi:hypothetical protein